ncbi:hypothetical protein D3C84_1111520 [compost metagenome]
MLPVPASLSCCTSRWERVSRVPLGLTAALTVNLEDFTASMYAIPTSGIWIIDRVAAVSCPGGRKGGKEGWGLSG